MSHDICKALDYLHNTARLLHGDLKSFNILIKGDFNLCKLCDFGVSQSLNEKGYLDVENHPDAAYTGTDLWSAPEVFHSEAADISSKADMFSFGLVIYECIALQAPHNDHSVIDDETEATVRGEPLTAINLEKINKKLFDESKDSDGYSMIVNTTDMENRSPNVKQLNDVSHITIGSDDDSFNNSKVSLANASQTSEMTDGSFSHDDPLSVYLGTRPLIPSQYDLSDEYNPIMEMFFLCTNELAEDRPAPGYLATFLATLIK